MNWRQKRLNRFLSSMDRDLFAKCHAHGRVDICRRVSELHKACRMTEELPPESQYLFSLTDTWKITGMPVERGFEQILQHINELDSWRNDSFFRDIEENRRRDKQNKDTSFRNEVRARAYDMRKDFARATNDIRMGD